MNEKAQSGVQPVSGDARAARSRVALRNTLISLLEQKPFEQVTIREIAAMAKIGYATFFRHYPSKEALLNDLAAYQIGGLTAVTLPLLHSADLQLTSRTMFEYVWAHKTLWAALLTGGAAGTVKTEFIRQMRQLAAAETPVDSWPPSDLRVAFSVAATLEILAWWLEQKEPASIEKMAQTLDRLVVEPSLADVPRVGLLEQHPHKAKTVR